MAFEDESKKKECDDTAEFLEKLSKADEAIKRETKKEMQGKESRSTAFAWIITIAILLGIVVFIFKGCSSIMSSIGDDSDDYTTYYEDDNGNGELDKGEWNYTEDEDGNVVDVDEDRSNWE